MAKDLIWGKRGRPVMTHSLRILYVGPVSGSGTCRQRLWTLQNLGHEVDVITTSPFFLERGKWLRRAGVRLNRYTGLRQPNWKILQRIEATQYDILWVDKGLKINRRTLEMVKMRGSSCRRISYSPDDMMNPANQSRHYLKAIPAYDLHVTTKSYNVAELQFLGAPRVLFVNNAFDDDVHKPDPAIEGFYRFDVGFIGDWEQERYEMMRYLTRNGISVTWVCPAWPTEIQVPPGMEVVENYLRDQKYAAALQQTKINLGFLRKVNRDLQTTRSVEIPACQGFLLAERTKEHMNLFEEGKEAAFFISQEELLLKVRYYLEHEQERERIAINGRFRCINSGYSNREMLTRVLKEALVSESKT